MKIDKEKLLSLIALFYVVKKSISIVKTSSNPDKEDTAVFNTIVKHSTEN